MGGGFYPGVKFQITIFVLLSGIFFQGCSDSKPETIDISQPSPTAVIALTTVTPTATPSGPPSPTATDTLPPEFPSPVPTPQSFHITGKFIGEDAHSIAGQLIWTQDAERPWWSDNTEPVTGTIEIDGLDFAFEAPAIGDYLIETKLAGYARIIHSILVDGDRDDIEIRLHPAASISGHIQQVINTQPLPGAEVLIEPMYVPQGQLGRYATYEGEKVTTDIDGYFCAQGLLPGVPHKLSASIPSHVRKEIENITPPKESLDIFLNPAGKITGTVRNAKTGEPLPNATVWGGSDKYLAKVITTSDETGRYVLSGFGNETVHIVAQTQDLILTYESIECPTIKTIQGECIDNVDLNLDRGFTLKIQVADKRGRPIPGAKIQVAMGPAMIPEFQKKLISPFQLPQTAVADRKGEAILSGLTGNPYTAEVYYPGHSCVPLDVFSMMPVPGLTFEKQAIMTDEYFIAGQVRNSTGAPIAGARIITGRNVGHQPTIYDVWTQTDGTFRIGGLVEGQAALHIFHPGYAPAEIDAETGREDIEIVLRDGASIEGKVIDALNRPVAEIEVKAALKLEHNNWKTRIEGWYNPGLTWSESDGSFVIDHLEKGEYEVRALTEDKISESVSCEVNWNSHRKDVALQLHNKLSVEGRVTDKETNEPIPAVTITLKRQRNNRNSDFEAETAADGKYQFQRLLPGYYMLMALPPAPYLEKNYIEDRKLQFELKSEDITGFDIQLEKGGTVHGRVIDQQGNPLPGIIMTAVTSGYSPMLSTKSDTLNLSGDNGEFTLTAVQPGASINVAGISEKYAPGLSEPFDLPAGGTVEGIAVTLGPWASVTGTIQNDKSEPLPNVMVNANPERSDLFAGRQFDHSFSKFLNDRAVSGNDGHYRINRVAPGKATLYLSRYASPQEEKSMGFPLYSPAKREIELAAGETIVEDFTITETPLNGRISGTLMTSDGVPQNGVSIWASQTPYGSEPGSQGKTESQADGSFSIENLVEGKAYLLHATFENEEGRFSIDEFRTTASQDGVELVLEKKAGRGTLRGVVKNEAGSIVPKFRIRFENVIGESDYEKPVYREGEEFITPDGTFEIKDIYECQCDVVAVADEMRGVQKSVKIESGQETETIEIIVQMGGTLSGTVTANGQPVQGAKIDDLGSGIPLFRIKPVESDNYGKFKIENIQDKTISLLVRHDEYAPETVESIDLSGGSAEVEIELNTGGAIEGHVYDGQGNVVAGAELNIHNRRQDINESANTDADGYYRIEKLPPGGYTVSYGMNLELAGERGLAGSGTGIVRENETTVIDLGKGEVTLYGKVIGQEQRLERWYILATPVQFSISQMGLRGIVKTDANGEYRLSGMQTGEYIVSAVLHNQQGGYPPTQQQIDCSEPGEYRLDFTIPETAFSGQVIDEQGKPIAQAQVHLRLLESQNHYLIPSSQSQITDEKGVFRFSSPMPGRYYLLVRAPDYARHEEELQIVANQPINDYRIVLQANAGTIAGSVISRDGSLIPAIVNAYAIEPAQEREIVPRMENLVPTNPDGSFQIKNLPPGRYNMDVKPQARYGYGYDMGMGGASMQMPRWIPKIIEAIEVRSGETTVINVELEESNPIAIYLFGEDGSTIQFIPNRPVSEFGLFITLTGPNGVTELSNKPFQSPMLTYGPSGSYTLRVRQKGYQEYMEKFELRENGQHVSQIEFVPAH